MQAPYYSVICRALYAIQHGRIYHHAVGSRGRTVVIAVDRLIWSKLAAIQHFENLGCVGIITKSVNSCGYFCLRSMHLIFNRFRKSANTVMQCSTMKYTPQCPCFPFRGAHGVHKRLLVPIAVSEAVLDCIIKPYK